MTGYDWNVLLTEGIDSAGLESLNDIAEITTASEYEDRASLRADVDRFDAILVRTAEITEELLDAADDLKVISKHGTGLDNVDIESASERDVVVCNTPHVNAPAVAEHTIALLLAVRKQLVAADTDVRRGTWNPNTRITHELRGDTLGLFGCGAIGNRVGEIAQSFGMECIAYDPYIDESGLSAGITMVSDETLFELADVISVHAPLTDETHGSISSSELTRLPDEGIVINTSRGEIIDENALVEVLDAGELAGAGLDVFVDEPPSPDNPLLTFDTVIATPHIGGSTVEALRQLSIDAANNIRTVYTGELPETTVNGDEIEHHNVE